MSGSRVSFARKALLATGLAASFAVGCGPTWYIDPAFGEKLAQEQSKPLLLYFKAWDSSAHRNMQRDVFSNSAVVAEMKDTINVEVEFNFYPEVAERFSVFRPQVCVMARPDGHKVYTTKYVNPVPDPEDFLNWLRAAKAEAMPTAPQTQPTDSAEKPASPAR